jgi:two-component system cell cycle sensor histidine kinase/response regulator CckA
VEEPRENYDKIKTYGSLLKRYIWVLALAWTIIIGTSLSWELYLTNKTIRDIAYFEAKISLDKDILYRRWNSEQGGVYVVASEHTPPNPYLSHIPDRDIKLPSGKTLTLMNPAYMTRQVYEMAKEEFGTLGHITSQRPVNPGNAPDAWETRALEAFSQGRKEMSSVEKVEGKEYMRLMYPFFTEQSCLKCHAIHGYTLGELRGGISASIPMAPIRAIMRGRVAETYISHMLIWAIGLGAIIFASRKLNRSETNRMIAVTALREEKDTAQKYLDIAGVMFLVIKADQTVGLINRKGCEILEFDEKGIAGKNWFDNYLPERERDSAKALFEKVIAGDTAFPEFFESSILTRNGGERIVEWHTSVLTDDAGNVVATLSSGTDITGRKLMEEEREKMISDLRESISRIKVLSGMLPICASCKKIRDDKGYWNMLEVYIRDHSEADFSHSVCPDCLKKLYPGYSKDNSE